MDNKEIVYRRIIPDACLNDFVECIWMLYNPSESDKEVVILPDGNIDLFFTRSLTEAFHITLLGIGTNPERAVIKAGRMTFALSCKPLGVEYMVGEGIADLQNKAKNLAVDFWGFCENDLDDFNLFATKMTRQLKSMLPTDIDPRKRKLFELIYASKGGLTVNELSEKVLWSSRQINRYFNKQLGISLKTYNSVVRFRASFLHIKAGKLYPEQNFADQSHFIKEVQRLAGVNPKKLMINQNDRFIQFSTLPDL